MKSPRILLRLITALAAVGLLTWSVQAADSGAKPPTTTAAPSSTTKPAAAKPPIGYDYDQTPMDRSNRERLTSYADMLEKVTPAVVSVYTTSRVARAPTRGRNRGNTPPQRPTEEGVGSGSIITTDGYIITNNHVVTTEDLNGERPADSIVVKLADGREFNAKFVGSDKGTDVALIKIEGKNLPTIKLADSSKLRVGDVVFAVGNPMDVGLTVTQGIVSATGRSHLDLLDDGFEDFIQTDASINPGNSGGPLVDANGRLVGLNSAILSTSFRPANMGIGFAVPSGIALHVVDSLIRDGKVKRGIMGVNLQTLDHDLAQGLGFTNSHGALVTEVKAGSPAEQAGLARGDLVLKLNSEDIDSSGKLRYLASMTAPGETVNLSIIRDGKPRTLNLRVGDRDQYIEAQKAQPSPSQVALVRSQPWENIPLEIPRVAGAAVLPLDREMRDTNGISPDVKGVFVVGTNPDSPLAELPDSAVIIEANKDAVYTAADLQRDIKPGAMNVFYVYYHGGYAYFATAMPEK